MLGHYTFNTGDRRLRLKPALVQDTDYMVEKTYSFAPYLEPVGAYLMHQLPIKVSKCV